MLIMILFFIIVVSAKKVKEIIRRSHPNSDLTKLPQDDYNVENGDIRPLTGKTSVVSF